MRGFEDTSGVSKVADVF